jgi:dTDP-4-amino-4,6-dideoxygalactose transaminase
MGEVQVPFVDLKQRSAEDKAELLACVEQVLDETQFILGPAVARFEAAAARAIGVPEVVGLNSGTDALMMALWAYGIGKGDEVITSPVSFVATTGAIVHVGATPVYVDVAADQNIDPAKIEAAITPKTKAIVPVHWAGRVADMDPIGAIARAHGLVVIEDAAQAMGATYRGNNAGTFGAAAAYSAHPLKLLATIGDAGFLAANTEIAAKVRLYRAHGLESRDSCVMYGVNSRLDALHAAILTYRMQKLAGVIEARRRHVALYRELVTAPQIVIPEERAHEQVAWTFCNARAERRDELRAYLAERGVETQLYYGTPLHLHPAAARLGYARGAFPEAEAQCASIVALPIQQYLTDEQIAYAAERINQFYRT